MADQSAAASGHAGNLPALALCVVLILFAYPLSMAPAFKLCLDNPKFAATFPFQAIYRQLIDYLCRHLYSGLGNLSYWYATTVWHLPMVRN
jgi:hypothetical protein